MLFDDRAMSLVSLIGFPLLLPTLHAYKQAYCIVYLNYTSSLLVRMFSLLLKVVRHHHDLNCIVLATFTVCAGYYYFA